MIDPPVAVTTRISLREGGDFCASQVIPDPSVASIGLDRFREEALANAAPDFFFCPIELVTQLRELEASGACGRALLGVAECHIDSPHPASRLIATSG